MFSPLFQKDLVDSMRLDRARSVINRVLIVVLAFDGQGKIRVCIKEPNMRHCFLVFLPQILPVTMEVS